MLIIFDLDDTLIDTSGAITPHKLKEAVLFLLERESKFDIELEYAKLSEINSRSLKTPHAIEEYGTLKGASKEKITKAISFLSEPLPLEFTVPCTPFAKEILKYYAERYKLALVTGGHPPFQLEKLKKAGIEPSLFSKIAIPEDSIKKPFYSDFAKELGVHPSEVWVCGDRIPMDLKPAYELGFKTIHMKWGRGKQFKNEPWIDFSISTLSELKDIIP